ncbi:Glu/Leu/Phe/Val dehydrogenase [Nocardioides sp. L-11A]|uniref:Glu/Leu/Phe/Val family dehydrogenase n=1 Tax=Nocardioides sp. L-11A TaxID=3043848 RepID=UPI00249C2142|nr:Glu/Leu/Phe/Val dehydrogenase dimerization domain-containing protein [Nocardioides sp. L-11A]
MSDHQALALETSEQLVTCRDTATGLRAVIAIDDTTLGPGLGGIRYRPYRDMWAAAEEAQRLASAMTLKNAMAGVPFGGAKSVILHDGTPPRGRDALFEQFGRFIARLGGTYVPGVDMGTSPHDLQTVGSAGTEVSCTDVDPSPWTALGVYHSIAAAVGQHLGAEGVAGIRVLVQGVGHVGGRLAELLSEAGAVVTVSDVDAARAASLAQRLGAASVAPDQVLGTPADVFAPCATARVITHENIATLPVQIVAGGANDTLEDDRCADELHARGILYVPDFVANGGGVIHVQAMREGWDEARTTEAIARIGDRVTHLIQRGRAEGTTPLAAALATARDIVAAAR